MNIAVFGTGYVGTVTGACFADLGNRVTCVDVDERKIERLRSGDPVIYEPGLRELLEKNLRAGRIEFTLDAVQAVEVAEVIFICVGTPTTPGGEADLSYVLSVARTIGKHIGGYKVIVDKSTVPVGTHDRVRRAVTEGQDGRGIPFDVVSNPEFLREGSAVADFSAPDRIVIGAETERARDLMEKLYSPITRMGRPCMFTTLSSAEMIKYASNAMLAVRISFMNELSHLCEKVGADIEDVARGMGLDGRIGPKFLQAGAGYGGSCFPKDVKALAALLKENGLYPIMLEATEAINERQKKSVVLKLKSLMPDLEGKTIAIWGLAFKPRTDDVREAPALTVIQQLLRSHVSRIRAFDPEAISNTQQALKELRVDLEKVIFSKDAYGALVGADALVILTEWEEFRSPDWGRVKELLRAPVVLDARNVFNPEDIRAQGISYASIGRP